MKRAIVLALLLISSALAGSVRAAERKPNIIFILADDLGYGDTGFSWQMTRRGDGAKIETPNLDRLASGGVTLTSHYCCAPVCAPSRASIITGKRQGNCSLRDNCFDRSFPETNTMASVLHNQGYATWAVGKWGIAGGGESGEPVASHPLDRGFDYFYGFLDHMAGHTYYHYEGFIRGAFMGITENRTNATESAKGIYSTDLFAAKAKQLISEHMERDPERPFFMYLAVNTVHGSAKCDDTLANKAPVHVPGRPYPKDGVVWPLEKEPREARNTWIDPKYAGLPAVAARYATSITRLDDAIGDLVRHLESCGIERDTLIIFTSDNGPANEYGVDPRTFESAGPFDGMKRDVYEGGMRVPAFAYWPARIEPGTVDNSPSQGHDWMATLADAASLAHVERLEDGVSLLPRWKVKSSADTSGLPSAPESTVCTQYEFPWDGNTEAFYEFKARKGEVRGLQQMVRKGDFVALRVRMRENPSNVRLYNVVSDPFEATNLAGKPEYAGLLREMTTLLDSLKTPTLLP